MSEQIYVTSDLHFGHDREFIWKARGYDSVDEMNEDYVHKWNITVDNDDDVDEVTDEDIAEFLDFKSAADVEAALSQEDEE